MTLSAEWQRSNRFHIRNRTTFHSCHCQPQQETYYFHTPDLWSMWTQHNFFFYTQIQPFQIQPKKIKISKIWNSANSLFKWRFWIVVIQKFCYHGNMMWRLILPIESRIQAQHISHPLKDIGAKDRLLTVYNNVCLDAIRINTFFSHLGYLAC